MSCCLLQIALKGGNSRRSRTTGLAKHCDGTGLAALMQREGRPALTYGALRFPCLMGSSLPDVFGAELESPQLTYEELLQVCPLGGTGAVDLTRVTRVADGRVVDLGEQPFNMQYMSRRWSRGAVIKALGKNGVADRAGIKVGDIIDSRPEEVRPDTLSWDVPATIAQILHHGQIKCSQSQSSGTSNAVSDYISSVSFPGYHQWRGRAERHTGTRRGASCGRPPSTFGGCAARAGGTALHPRGPAGEAPL